MTKLSVLAISSTAMFLVLSVIAYIIPEPAAATVALFTLPFLFALLLGILVGGLYPFALMFAPVIGYFITQEGDFWREVLPEMMLVGSAGFFAGLTYGKFRTVIGSNLMGFFAGVLFYGVARLLACLLSGEAYQLIDLCRERFLHPWPGVALCLFLPPIVCALLRKAGVLKVLRDGLD